MTATKHVLLTLGRLNYGGAEKRLLALLEALKAAAAPLRFTIYVISGKPGVLDDRFAATGARIVMGRPGVRGLGHFHRTLKEDPVDIVHANTMMASGLYLAVAKAAGVPERYAHMRNTQAQGGLSRAVKDGVFGAALRRSATGVVGVAEATRAVTGLGPERFATIYNGLDIADTGPSRPSGPIKLLMLGRIAPAKAPLRAIPIVRAMVEAKVDMTLDVVGATDTPLAAELERRIAEEGLGDHVYLRGESDTPTMWFEGAHVSILLSRHEGLPGTVLEALSVGTPVVATDLPGVREIAVRTMGVTIMPDDASPERWSHAIVAAAGIGDAGRAEIAASFAKSPFVIERHMELMRLLWDQGFAAVKQRIEQER
ncbi:glycosyltransferase family 4 protein [Sphingomicrobium arenosum]|uniref:glycosyltransferase family 4 protein n=1 Tax=Sphingomicrobium arenosum TaxID=2233861 RepID=UPI002240B79F|nr:glycosyltransferase family 4 protein [Sphingomicrobium arenosum]